MQCMACGSLIKTGMAACPVCDFPVIWFVEKPEMEKPDLQNAAEAYLKSKLSEIQIGMITYQYEYKEGQLVIRDTYEHTIHTIRNFKVGDVFWYERAFARLKAGETMQLKGVITTPGKQKRTMTTHVIMPDIKTLCLVGIELRPGLMFRYLVGNHKNYNYSKDIYLM